MSGPLFIFAILLFSVVTDSVQEYWPHAVFRAAACVLCAVFLVNAVRRHAIGTHWSLLILALPSAWGLTQLLVHSTVWRLVTWQATLQWIAYLALFFCVLQQQKALRSQLHLIAWFGGAFGVYAILQSFLWTSPDEPMMATFLNHNHYAALMELIFPIALWRLTRDTKKAIAAFCALAILGSVIVSGSRAGAALLVMEAIYLASRTLRKPLFAILGALLIALIAAALMWNRFQGLITPEPYESRKETAQASIQMIGDRPLFGFGLGTWPNIYPAFAVRDTGFRLIHADNDWLEWGAEGGLPFLGLMLSIAGLAAWTAWKEPWCVGCVAVFLHSLVEFPMQKLAIWAWFVVLLAIGQTARNSDKAVRKQES
jgi:O-antigen ligase